MKSRVYLMSLAILMGMSGKVFASADDGDDLAARRPWASEAQKKELRGYNFHYYYLMSYIPTLNFDQLTDEAEVVEDEVSAAKKNLDTAMQQFIDQPFRSTGAEPDPVLSKFTHKYNSALYRQAVVTNKLRKLDPHPASAIKGAEE